MESSHRKWKGSFTTTLRENGAHLELLIEERHGPVLSYPILVSFTEKENKEFDLEEATSSESGLSKSKEKEKPGPSGLFVSSSRKPVKTQFRQKKVAIAREFSCGQWLSKKSLSPRKHKGSRSKNFIPHREITTDPQAEAIWTLCFPDD